MILNKDVPQIDEAFIRKQAEKVSDTDIEFVSEHSEEIEQSFIGRGPIGKFVEELILALSIIKDYATGDYRKIPYWAIAALVFMILYVANPVDIIPDFLIGIGQIDDLIVISICLLMVRQELHEYRDWKQQRSDDEGLE